MSNDDFYRILHELKLSIYKGHKQNKNGVTGMDNAFHPESNSLFHPSFRTLRIIIYITWRARWTRTKRSTQSHDCKQGMAALSLSDIPLVQQHHLPEGSWVTIKEYSYKTISFILEKCHILYFSFKKYTAHKLMKDSLSPSLVNEERPERVFDSNSKWRPLANAQSLQFGAVELSIFGALCSYDGTVSNRS